MPSEPRDGSGQWQRARELFAEAVELDSAERAAFLDRHCGEDAWLRREIDSLLAHDTGPGDDPGDSIREVVGKAAAEIVGDEAAGPIDSLIGRQVGNIRVQELLGQGGMGEVYVGFDERLRRRVALKAIRARHRLAASARARFLREARILSQLEHPNICRIYDFVEGDDSDLLILELIEGRNLATAIAEGLEPRQRLRVAIQIAEVLEAAHGKGVVHRDLKPQNVMVTPAGDTKVLDFGLARTETQPPQDEVEATPDEPPPETPDEDDPKILYTRQGEIVGTPVYMSPEQANGETVTPASDMYSFGLLLQKLFTGESPYPRHLKSSQILERARSGQTLPVTGIDRDLAALIQRLKSIAPAARPTAVEALGRLHWIAAKPKRRLRRLTAAAVLLLAALGVTKYTFDLRAARDEATARRAQAEGLLGFMLKDLRSSLEPLGRLDLLDKVGDEAMAYFAASPGGGLSDEELARQAQALTQIGEVRVSQLRYDEALSAFLRAHERAADLSRREPEDGERLFDRGQAEFWVGNTYYNRADFEQARAWLGRYLATSESLLELDPERDGWIREVAYGHHNLAVMARELGELEAAAKGFERMIGVLKALRERRPQDGALAVDLADAHSWLGSTQRRRADFGAAAAAFRESSNLFSELVSRDPDNQQWQYWRANGSVLEARVAAMAGDLDRALQLLGDGLASLDRLAAADPGNRRWRRVRASARIDRAQVLAARGDLAAALAEAADAGAELAELLAVEPTDRKALQFRVRGWRLEGALRLDLGQVESARQVLLQAREVAESALRGDGARDPIFQTELASILVLLGEHQVTQRNPAAARAQWQAALEVVGEPIDQVEDPDFLDPWLRAQLLLGHSDLAAPVIARLARAGYRPWRAWPQSVEYAIRK